MVRECEHGHAIDEEHIEWSPPQMALVELGDDIASLCVVQVGVSLDVVWDGDVPTLFQHTSVRLYDGPEDDDQKDGDEFI